NRKYGEAYVQGEKFEKLAEGVATASALMTLGKKYNVELPIVATVHDVLFNNSEPKSALSKLFLRSIKDEF
ncbi:MAG: glycerol-3-phosphate dehydrogenase, partial [Bacillota bacterium]|nr:glycerol-3-phosphate dehydrogenase [Bacillota bacterium]